MKKLIYLLAVLSVAALVSTGCKKKDPEAVLNVSKVSLADVPVAGKTETVTITSNLAWTITGATEWCTVTPASGEGNGSVTIAVAANEEADARSTTLKISASGAATVDIPVSQAVDNVLNALTDPAFKKWADANLAEGSGRLSSEEAAKVEQIVIILANDESVKDIKSLEGIQNFTGLKNLAIGGTAEVPCDVRVSEYIAGLETLENLNFKYNTVTETLNTKAMTKLKTLDVGRCPNLTFELGEHLLLETASFVANTKLTTLSFKNYSKLTTLNLSECSALTTVSISSCALLETLKLSNTPKLASLTLDGLPKLAGAIGITRSQLTTVSISNCGLTLINVSDNANLTTVSVADCAKLESLSVSKNPKLTTLTVENCPSMVDQFFSSETPALESITIKGLNAMTNLALINRPALKSFSITDCAKLESLNVGNSGVEVLTIKNLPALTTNLFWNNTKFKEVTIQNIGLAAITIRDRAELVKFAINDCPELTTLNFIVCSKLEDINCSKNAKLKTLSITGSDGLKKLRVNNTVVGPTIDISSYKSLTEFDCSNSSVTTVNTYWEPGKKPATVTTYSIGNAKEVKK